MSSTYIVYIFTRNKSCKGRGLLVKVAFTFSTSVPEWWWTIQDVIGLMHDAGGTWPGLLGSSMLDERWFPFSQKKFHLSHHQGQESIDLNFMYGKYCSGREQKHSLLHQIHLGLLFLLFPCPRSMILKTLLEFREDVDDDGGDRKIKIQLLCRGVYNTTQKKYGRMSQPNYLCSVITLSIPILLNPRQCLFSVLDTLFLRWLNDTRPERNKTVVLALIH